MSPLVLGDILRVCVKTLTADGTYRVLGCENWQLPIHMQLSEKRTTFSQFFRPFLECTSNFKPLEKNVIVTTNVFPKLETLKILVRPLSKKRRFKAGFGSQHVKASQMLAKFP